MTPDPDPPARGSTPSVRRATVPMTKEPEEPRESTEPGPPEHDVPLPPDLVAGEHDRRDRTHRPWSARRVSAALVASVILVAAVVALVDVVAVRAGRPAAAWRRHLADELATRPLDDVWVLTGAAVAAVLGIWLIVLALTPAYATGCPCAPPRPGCGLPWTATAPPTCCATPPCGSRESVGLASGCAATASRPARTSDSATPSG